MTNAPAHDTAAFYVLGVETPWVLTNEGPQKLDKCRRDIAWQKRGGTDPLTWAICYWDADAQTFRELDGSRTFDVTRGPYTVEAHSRFMSTLALRPDYEALARSAGWFPL